MRVCAGLYKHRVLKITNLDTTRETQDKVKQAIFNMIGPNFYNKVACDLFSGSGAIGIEALSRGFCKVYFNDFNKLAYKTIKENIENLSIPKSNFEIDNSDYLKYLQTKKIKVDVLFLDPPYNLNDTSSILNHVIDSEILNDDSIIVFEMAKDTKIEEVNNLTIIKNKSYGSKKVVVLQFNQ